MSDEGDRPGRRGAGRRALFSDPSAPPGFDPGEPAAGPPPSTGRRALFSPPGPPDPGPDEPVGRLEAVVHCRTCLTATPMSIPAVAWGLVPSLWLPTRPWPRLMRCPACRRVSWCRIDWPRLI
jgi:hypothetical protein